MSAIVAFAGTIGLLLVSAAALIAALVVTRQKRRDLEQRVSFVSGSAQPDHRAKPIQSPPGIAAPKSRAPIRRLFSIGTDRQWGMRANGVVLVAVAIVAALAAWLIAHAALHFSYPITILAVVGGFVLAPRTLLLRQQRGTEQRFMVLFPDAIDMVIRMVRAGLPITAAARAIANDAPEPVNIVFRTLADRVDIGVPFEDALTLAGEEVGLPDFRFFCVAISLQRATGGNLVATLEIMAEIIRKRRTVRLRAQAMTGEIRMSAYILGGLPFLVTGAMLVISPAYMVPLITDPRGNVIVGIALLGLALAFVTMRQMLRSVTMA